MIYGTFEYLYVGGSCWILINQADIGKKMKPANSDWNITQMFNSECNWTHQNMKWIFRNLKIFNWSLWIRQRSVFRAFVYWGQYRIKPGWYRIAVIPFSIVMLRGIWELTEAQVWGCCYQRVQWEPKCPSHLGFNEITLHPDTPVSVPVCHIHTGITIREAAQLWMSQHPCPWALSHPS